MYGLLPSSVSLLIYCIYLNYITYITWINHETANRTRSQVACGAKVDESWWQFDEKSMTIRQKVDDNSTKSRWQFDKKVDDNSTKSQWQFDEKSTKILWKFDEKLMMKSQQCWHNVRGPFKSCLRLSVRLPSLVSEHKRHSTVGVPFIVKTFRKGQLMYVYLDTRY
jgi:hypothetical protein